MRRIKKTHIGMCHMGRDFKSPRKRRKGGQWGQPHVRTIVRPQGAVRGMGCLNLFYFIVISTFFVYLSYVIISEIVG